MPSRTDEIKRKHQQVVKYMDQHSLDAVVLSQRPNFAWFTAGGVNHVATHVNEGVASLLIERERLLCLTNEIEQPRMIREELADSSIEVQAFPWYDPDAATCQWERMIGARAAACDVPVPALPHSVRALSSDFHRLRWVMNEQEVDRYRPLAREVAEGLEQACRETRRGQTEYELAARISAAMWMRGCRTAVILTAADERIEQYRHPLPTGKRFERYGMGVVGAERDGLYVSVSRLFSYGKVSDELAGRHRAVCAVDAALIGGSHVQRTLEEVFAVGQQAYAAQGFADEWKMHHQGGLAGYQPREVKAAPGIHVKLQPNMILAWNPTIAGTKSEDTVLVREQGNEIISATGQWPTSEYESDGRTWSRPDILVM